MKSECAQSDRAAKYPFEHGTEPIGGDFLQIAAERQRAGEFFRGIVYAHLMRVTVKTCIDELELIAGAMESGEIEHRLIHLPLRI